MKKTIATLAALLPLVSPARTDVYRFRASVKVPRVYDNAQSLGYRKYQTQRLEGILRVTPGKGLEPKVELALTNRTHKVGGSPVTYETDVGGALWHVVGSNKTGVFKTPSVKFSVDANPSYNIGADEPDNTLILTFAGKGTSWKRLSGYAAGQLGCGCYAYGHTSPTRLLYDLTTPVDTAAAWGTWNAKYLRTEE